MHRPKDNFNVAMMILTPVTQTVSGVLKKTYTDVGDVFFGSFKTYGGTERELNGVRVVEDTAVVETWYRPDIKANVRIKLETGEVYDIIGEPEDIEKRHQFMKFKLTRVKGGA